MTITNVQTSDFYCVECGKKGIPIMRPDNHSREPGHLKKLYCIHCGKETNHCEIRPFGSYTLDDFQKEYKLGRFVDSQRIPLEELVTCSAIDCNYNVNSKCWNANNSYLCKYKPIIKKENNK